MRVPACIASLALAQCILVTGAQAAHPLDYVPVDTAYLYARAQPLDAAQLQISQLRSASISLVHAGYQLQELVSLLDEWDNLFGDSDEVDSATDPDDLPDAGEESADLPAAGDHEDVEDAAAAAGVATQAWMASSQRRVLLALRDAFLQVRTPADLSRIGIKPNGTFAFYASGLYPVLRFEAAGLAELRQLVESLEQAQGSSLAQLGTRREPVWLLGEEGAQVALGRVDDQVVLAFVPGLIDSQSLQHILAKPKRALGAAGLKAFNRKHGFNAFGSGYYDLVRTMQLVLALETEPAQQEGACAQELQALAAILPRMTVGYTRVDERAMEVRFTAELRKDLATALQPLAARAPRLETAQTSAGLSLAVDLVKALEFTQARVAAVRDAPWQCSELIEFNSSVATLGQELAQMPTMLLAGFQGFSMAVERLAFAEDGVAPRQFDLSAAVHSTQPAPLLGWLQLLLPQLAQSGLQADGKPVQLPGEALPETLKPLSVVQTDQLLAAASGADARQRLEQMVADTRTGNTALLGLRFGPAGLHWISKMMALDPATLALPEAERERSLEYAAALSSELRYVDLRLSVVPAGIEMYQTVALKPAR